MSTVFYTLPRNSYRDHCVQLRRSSGSAISSLTNQPLPPPPVDTLLPSPSSASTTSSSSSSSLESFTLRPSNSENALTRPISTVETATATIYRRPVSNSHKIYYALDSFEDLKALRKATQDTCKGFLPPPPIPLVNEKKSNASKKKSSIYGDTDSAYDSSQESLKRLSASSALSLNASLYSTLDSAGGQRKYMTLPTKFGRRMKKNSAASSNTTLAASSIFEHDSISMIDSKPPVPSLIGNGDCGSVKSHHCCCLSGYHSEPRRQDDNVDCCQKKLETLWEEPVSNICENLKQGDTTCCLQRQLSLLQLKDKSNSTSSNNWLKGSLLNAFRRPKGRSTSSLETINFLQQIVDNLKCQLSSSENRYRNSCDQIRNLKNELDTVRNDLHSVSLERDRLRANQTVLPQPQFHFQAEPIMVNSIDVKQVVVKCGLQYIGTVGVASNTDWEQLDEKIRTVFSSYYQNSIDVNCIVYYLVGADKMKRILLEPYKTRPELLPVGYLVESRLITLAIDETRM